MDRLAQFLRKKGSKADVNIRPITLLCTVSKCFRQVIGRLCCQFFQSFSNAFTIWFSINKISYSSNYYLFRENIIVQL